MSKLIDADDFFMKMYNAAHPVTHGYSEREAGLTVYGIAQLLDEQPTVDAVEVVRCKDCKYLDESLAVGSWDGACKYWKTHSTNYNWFCSNGKRREVTE